MTETKTERFGSELQARLVALTRDMMLIPSTEERPDDIARCFELLRNHIEPLENVNMQEYIINGKTSLVVLPDHTQAPEVLLCGHLDVITHPELSMYRSKVESGRIIGPGAGDMKGALAILFELFKDFHTQHPDASLGLVITSDEETGGESGVGYLVEKENLRCGVAIIPDGGSLDRLTVEEKGILHLHLTCKGHAAHAARPWLGINPLEQLMDGLGFLRAEFEGMKVYNDPDHWYPTCAVTIMRTANETRNRVPEKAEAFLDIRFPPPYKVQEILAEVKSCLGEDIDVVEIISAETTHLSPDALYLDVAEEVTGRKPDLVRDSGGSDARFICNHGIPVIMTRPLVGELHSSEEWIDIASMETLYRVYERYLERKLLKA